MTGQQNARSQMRRRPNKKRGVAAAFFNSICRS
jgi:hypothetical protein